MSERNVRMTPLGYGKPIVIDVARAMRVLSDYVSDVSQAEAGVIIFRHNGRWQSTIRADALVEALLDEDRREQVLTLSPLPTCALFPSWWTPDQPSAWRAIDPDSDEELRDTRFFALADAQSRYPSIAFERVVVDARTGEELLAPATDE